MHYSDSMQTELLDGASIDRATLPGSLCLDRADELHIVVVTQ